MKAGFFSKIACTNIGKNYRFFIPRIISEAGLLGVFFIVFTLHTDDRILSIRGGAYLASFMEIGVWIIMLLSAILMFYTNSFLMKQRKREFGLFNVLGMEKHHIGKVLFYESLFVSTIAVLTGWLLGILFYKACSLLICKLLQTEIILGFYFVKPGNLAVSGGYFLALDIIAYCSNRIAIARLKPVELLDSRSAGEREPKVKWLMLIVGFITLCVGYIISIFTKQPLQAILLFFVAVILVIIGTYFLFVSGSIFVLKTLKRNKAFYYTPKHMPSVAGLLYRMKQNAVGLASICILSTGVLVMISTTVSLYAGMDDSLQSNYPQDCYLSFAINDVAVPFETCEQVLKQAAQKNNLPIERIEEQRFFEAAYFYADGVFKAEAPTLNIQANLSGLTSVTFITEKYYPLFGSEPLALEEDEIAICSISSFKHLPEDKVTIDGKQFRIKQIIPTFPIRNAMISSVNTLGIVVANDAVFDELYGKQVDVYGENASEIENRVAVTFARNADIYTYGLDFSADVWDAMDVVLANMDYDESNYSSTALFDSIWAAKEDYLAMYGTLLFLGLILGFVCLFAMVLIVYYKQISEGFEDRERFQIMEKIGMSAKEVRSTINSQVLLVFFLPLIVAAVHLAFAFPILERILHVFMLSGTALFVICTLITYVVFALVYTLIYICTARTYYKIVH